MLARLFSLLKSRKKTPTDVCSTAAALAAYFGTWREQPFRSDPRQHGHAIIQMLASVPGPAAAVLRARAERAIGAGTWPEELTRWSAGYALTARAIGEVCRHLAAL